MATRDHYHVWSYSYDKLGRARRMVRRGGHLSRQNAHRALVRDFAGKGHVLKCSDPTCRFDKQAALPIESPD